MVCKDKNGTCMSEKEFSKELLEAVQAKAVNQRLDCAAARVLAAELKVSIADVGDMANQLGIKIKNCQLGCF